MFDRTAARYDLLNDLMTGGMDRRWRREVVRALAARPGELVLDLAAGTGTSSVPFAESGALTVACDFSLGMLREGKAMADYPYLVEPAGKMFDEIVWWASTLREGREAALEAQAA